MNPERWQEIERLYNKALELAPGERAAFLEKACAGNETLYREVDSLLASRSGIDCFMENPAMEVAAREIAQDRGRVEATLTAGQGIAHYRVGGEIGRGGMGVVYRAEDTKLKRSVALKCLPQAFAADPERLARFEREARILASLNHPNIAAIHGLEEAAGQSFIVMEFVEGETLAQRIAKGPLPVQETLDVCCQIAEGLEGAHEKGIIHRDLKPANIKITPEGKVKVLDFGLAKAFHDELAAVELSNSPTLTDRMTRSGVILGTAAYMSPEQAKGKAVDRRTDIWAFGCMLYECLTGRLPFEGETVTETVAKILEETPDWDLLPSAMPRKTKELLHRCLRKNPRERLHDIADARIEIAEALSQPSVPNEVPTHRSVRVWMFSALVGIAILAFLAGGLLFHFLWKSPPAPKEPQYFTLKLPADAPLAKPEDLPGGLDNVSLAISPDGRRFAYVAIHNGIRRLYARQIDEEQFRSLQGTEGASNPFFRPDGEWLGFHSGGKLKRVAFSGGSASEICAVSDNIFGGNWQRDGSVILCDGDERLISVPQGKGAPEILFDPKTLSQGIFFPRMQPDGKTVLGSGWIGDSRLLSLPTASVRTIFDIGGYPYLTSTGHLVAAGAGVLLAAPFDAKNNSVGDPRTVLEELRTHFFAGAQYALSDTGMLLYAKGGPTDEGKLVGVDRNGNPRDLGVPPGRYQHVSMARESDLVAVSRRDEDGMHVFVIDLRRPSSLKRLTSDGTVNACPVLSPEGDKVAFFSDRGGTTDLWVQTAEDNSSTGQLLGLDRATWPYSWSEDGLSLIFGGYGPRGNDILKVTEVGKKSQSRVLLDSGSDTYWGMWSPDRRRLLYVSVTDGLQQICLRSWPEDSSGEIQITSQGGAEPLWSADGKELFYRNGNQYMRVAVPDSLDFWIPKPESMFTGDYLNVTHKPWDIMPDGQHFIMIQPTHPHPPGTELYIIQNWFEELKRRVPTGK